MNIKNTITSIAATGLFLVNAGMISAAGQSNCQIVYGGGEVCQEQVKFTVDKKVMSPNKGGSFVENLTVNDARFAPQQEASFQITVTNTGSQTIPTLTITDTLPSHLSFVSGPGSYNQSNNTITYTISNLEAGKSNTQTFVTKIANRDNLPQNQTVTCINNTVKVTDNNGNSAQDSSALCIETSISMTPTPTPMVFNKIPVKDVPKTGPEILALAGLIPAGLTGLMLRKKSKIN